MRKMIWSYQMLLRGVPVSPTAISPTPVLPIPISPTPVSPIMKFYTIPVSPTVMFFLWINFVMLLHREVIR